MKNTKDILFVIVIAVCLIFFLKLFVLDLKIVASESMEPTINKGEIVIISKLAYNIFGIEYNAPKPKEIVAFKYGDKVLIKRIDNINSQLEYYVLGDNTYNSHDSRDFGYIEHNTILGKAIIRFNLKNFSISFLH